METKILNTNIPIIEDEGTPGQVTNVMSALIDRHKELLGIPERSAEEEAEFQAINTIGRGARVVTTVTNTGINYQQR